MAEKKTIHEALVTVCGAVENVKRDTSGQVGNSKYKYATIDAVLEVTQPLLKANGLALVQYVEDDSMVATLYHDGGESLPMGRYNLGGFVDSQKRGSAITYARRYQLCSIFGIAQEDDDGAADARTRPAGEPKVKGAMGTKVARKEFEERLIKLMESAPDHGELRAVWEEAGPDLAKLKASDNEDDNHTYTHLLRVKDMAKDSISSMQSINNILA